MKKMIFLALFLFMQGSRCADETATVWPNRFDCDALLTSAMAQYTKAVNSLTDTTRMPIHNKADGTWVQKSTSDWVSGFFPGILWYFYDYSGEQQWLQSARKWNAALEQEKFNTSSHDVGFMLYCSFGNGYRLTGDEAYKAILLQGAESLITRFNSNVGAIKSWDSAPENHLTIIDNMMNLELLCWASQASGDPKFRDIAIRHSDVTLANHFRPDFSSYHVLNYNPQTGAVMEKKTHQGYSDESMWARGQAWGGYGYTMMYRFTRDRRYLAIAQKTFDRFIQRLPADFIPYWDFDAPNIPHEPREASAAAIAASGLLELSTYADSTGLKNRYYQTAVNLLKALSTSDYLATSGKYQCLLLHSNGSVPGQADIDVNVAYADYYYVEALLRLKKLLEGKPLFQPS
ncbi:MAG: glycoside hydrolase family 88 protein [Candidatus Zhuqueibacterota bacterium]